MHRSLLLLLLLMMMIQFICARIVAGIGIGFINTIIPSWVSELSSAHNRGANFALVFVANYLGIVIAYWLNFGIRDTDPEFRWRFPFAFMCIPMLVVLFSIPLLPESPRYVMVIPLSIGIAFLTFTYRWLIANHRRVEAVEILAKLRNDVAEDDPKLAAEIAELDAIVQDSGHRRNSYVNIFLGGRYSGALHLGRRAVMGAALQTIQQWTGILAIVSTMGQRWLNICDLPNSLHLGNLGRSTIRARWLRLLQIELACRADQHAWHLWNGGGIHRDRSARQKEVPTHLFHRPGSLSSLLAGSSKPRKTTRDTTRRPRQHSVQQQHHSHLSSCGSSQCSTSCLVGSTAVRSGPRKSAPKGTV
jgi:hypothetical protein